MIDFRLETFLTLCETKNYTRTAEVLHITQPAVSQHIKYLEKQYKAKLFIYAFKTLSLTSKGKLLRDFALAMRANSNKISEILKNPHLEPLKVNFGATLSIGEYIMPRILKDYLLQYPSSNLCMYVDNTASLLSKLNHGEIDFALVEGSFNKSDYEYSLLSEEKFIPVCSSKSPLAKGKHSLDSLINQRIIIREPGSGTRNVLESALYEHSLLLNNFHSTVEISNFSVIKELVKADIGITFAYEEVVSEEIIKNELSPIHIPNFHIKREFNFVYLKDSIFEKSNIEFFSYCKKHI